LANSLVVDNGIASFELDSWDIEESRDHLGRFLARGKFSLARNRIKRCADGPYRGSLPAWLPLQRRRLPEEPQRSESTLASNC
jgi:hypothetical protein